jgi:hypothetical protein
MKVAILSESPADEAAIRILIEGILGESIEPVTFRARAGGWNAVIRVISPTLKDLHYRRTADALVVVIDSDNSQVHDDSHGDLEDVPDDCRTCGLRSAIKSCQDGLKTVPGLSPIPTAIAVPTPAIEAWYLFGEDSNCTETGWKQRQQTNVSSVGEIHRLKILAYGNDRPDIKLQKTVGIERAHRLLDQLEELAGYFPNSFGSLAREIRKWT